MVTIAAATKTTSTFPTRAPAQHRVNHFVAITSSDPNDSCDLYAADCRSYAQLVSPSRDPIGYVGSRWNTYRYVNDSPTNYIDPEGLADPITCAAAASATGSTFTGIGTLGGGGTIATSSGTVLTVGTGVTVGVAVGGGAAVGTGIYYCPGIGTKRRLEPWLTRLCYRIAPVNLPPPTEVERRGPKYPACCSWYQANAIGEKPIKRLRRDVMCDGGEGLFECCVRHQAESGIPPLIPNTVPLPPPPHWFGDAGDTRVGNCPESE